MMTKSKARSPGGLLRHLARADTNEVVRVGASRGVTPTISEGMEELAIRSATVSAKKTWFHTVGNFEPGQAVTEEAWEAYWAVVEAEFGLATQPFIEVQHRKKVRDHRHRVYCLVRDDGRLVSVSHNYRRNELVSRLGEVAAGHPINPGKHHRWVIAELAQRGVALPGPAVQAVTHSSLFSQAEHQQAERKLGTDPRAFKARVYDLYVQSCGDWRVFASRLDQDHITIAKGHSAVLVVDERSRLHLPLARLLREEAKRAGKPIKIRSINLEAVFGRANPLKAEQVAIDRRQRGVGPVSQPSGPAEAAPAQAAADVFAAHMQAAVVQLLQQEKRRAERLRLNRARKAARRRGDLDAKIAALADDMTVAVAAGIIRHLRSRHGARTVVLIITALATGSGIAPVLLAAAAAVFLRRGLLDAERALFRADVNEAKAAKTGWVFADVPKSDRARYAQLARSNLINPTGPDAGPLIAAVGQHNAAKFVAWWAYATPTQRAVVEGWGRQRPPKRRPTGRRGPEIGE